MAKFLDQAGVVYLLDRIHEIINKIQVGDVNLTDYVKKEELQAELDKLDIDIDLSDYMTTQEISNALTKKANAIHTHSEYLTQHQDLSAYAKKTDMPTVPENVSSFANDANYATTSYVDNAISYVESDVYYGTEEPTDGSLIWLKPDGEVDVYATKEYVDESIANAQIEGGEVDLSDYALKSEIPDVSNFITSVPSEYVTETELNNKGYLTEHQSLSDYATKTYVQDEIDKIDTSVTVEGIGMVGTGVCAEIFNYDSYFNPDNVASGSYSHAKGRNTTASATCAYAEGLNTIAAGDFQHVQGKFNIEDTNEKYAHIVGNGDATTRKNAHTLDWNGNAWFSGKVYVGGTSMDDATELGAGGSVDLTNYYNKEETDALIPSDEHINSLINAKLEVIRNGSY